jgi:Fic family protein
MPIHNKSDISTEAFLAEKLGLSENSSVVINSFVKKDNSPKFEKDFIFVFQDFLKMAASYQFKNKASYQLLIAIMGYTQYGNYFSIDVEDIAEVTNNSKRTVLRAINELKDLNILIPIVNRNDRRRTDYSINHNAIWKGKSEERKLVIDKYPKEPNLFSNIGDILSIDR